MSIEMSSLDKILFFPLPLDCKVRLHKRERANKYSGIHRIVLMSSEHLSFDLQRMSPLKTLRTFVRVSTLIKASGEINAQFIASTYQSNLQNYLNRLKPLDA